MKTLIWCYQRIICFFFGHSIACDGFKVDEQDRCLRKSRCLTCGHSWEDEVTDRIMKSAVKHHVLKFPHDTAFQRKHGTHPD
jgi:hypothetical protein